MELGDQNWHVGYSSQELQQPCYQQLQLQQQPCYQQPQLQQQQEEEEDYADDDVFDYNMTAQWKPPLLPYYQQLEEEEDDDKEKEYGDVCDCNIAARWQNSYRQLRRTSELM